MRNVGTRRTVLTTVVAICQPATVVEPTFAQVSQRSQTRATIDADTTFVVRTSEAIDVKSADGLIFQGTVEEDVLDRDGYVAIPEGSTVELLARKDAEEMTTRSRVGNRGR